VGRHGLGREGRMHGIWSLGWGWAGILWWGVSHAGEKSANMTCYILFRGRWWGFLNRRVLGRAPRCNIVLGGV